MQNQSLEYSIISMLIVVLFCISLAFIARALRKIQEKVIETSRRYNALVKLNIRFDFCDSLKDEYHISFWANSKTKFDRFDFDKGMKAKIADEKSYYQEILRQIKHNNVEYNRYREELSLLPDLTEKKQFSIASKLYRHYEKRAIESEILAPITDVKFYAHNRYVSPRGRNSYYDYRIYSPDQIGNLINEIEKTERYKASKEYQRSIMSDSLRYKILKRDGFRCVLCGRTAADGVKLHVDHIKPIAKGGKTIESNLRTLCDQCNIGKSDKYDDTGIN